MEIKLNQVKSGQHDATTGKFYELALFSVEGEWLVVRRYGKKEQMRRGGAIMIESHKGNFGSASAVFTRLAGEKAQKGYRLEGGWIDSSVLGGERRTLMLDPDRVLSHYEGASGFDKLKNIIDAARKDEPKPPSVAPSKVPEAAKMDGWGAW